MSEAQSIAVIDIGTNSVLLTIVALGADGTITPLVEEAHITRIGEGLGAGQLFNEVAMERTATVLHHYKEVCERQGVEKIVAVGTAAFRRARNAGDFVAAIESRMGLGIEIISGEREAQLSYRAATRDFGPHILVLDIGGGSTEYIWCADEKVNGVSLPLGSVVLHEKYVTTDPISVSEFVLLETHILTELMQVYGSTWGGGSGAMQSGVPDKLVALAGTATTLVAMELQLKSYSHDQVHGTSLSNSQITSLLNRLRAATLEERKQMPGLEPARADVVLEGALILDQTMKLFGYESVMISDRGVRWGLIYEQFSPLNA